MEVTYLLTSDDYARFLLHQVRRTQAYKSRGPAYWWFMPSACLLLSMIGLLTNERIKNVLLFIIAAGAVWALLTFLLCYRRTLEKSCKLSADGTLKPDNVRLILNDDTVTEVTTTVKAEIRWSDVCKIDELEDYIFIYFTPTQIAIVPKLGFAGIDEFEEVKRYAQERLRKHGA